MKLTQAPQPDIRRVTKIAQEAFLRQLLEYGFMHADPHPGGCMRGVILTFKTVWGGGERDGGVMIHSWIERLSQIIDFDSMEQPLLVRSMSPPSPERASKQAGGIIVSSVPQPIQSTNHPPPPTHTPKTHPHTHQAT